MENALHVDRESGWSQRTHLDFIDRDAWIDHHILNTLACNPDALIRSAYFTKRANGKLAAGPVWDFDRALGSHADPRSYRWDVWSGVGGADVWHAGWWGTLAQDPEFIQGWIDRWQAVRRSELSNAALRHQVTTLGENVTRDAAGRDAARWPENRNSHGSYAAQVEYSGSWTVQRAQWIDEQFVAAPAVTRNGASITFTPPPGAALVFTLDGSDPRSLGGEIAPTAEMTSEPLEVANSGNVHVRSYDANHRGRFPGSPWSAALGTESASPLTPRARLVNLSSRAVTGAAGEPLIVGVAVTDTTSKRYLARAIGPGLTHFGVSGFAPDPQLSVFSGTTELDRNRGWETGNATADLIRDAKIVGAFPLSSGSGDCALGRELPAGACTFQVNSDQGGIALAELYELDERGRIANLSTRARVSGRERALIGGFVVRGPAYQRVLVRAIGPTLQQLGISDALADPRLSLYSGPKAIASSTHWGTAANVAAIQKATASVGAFALDAGSSDAVLLLTLPPGAYTAEVNGAAGAEGVALLEIYAVP
jgi:hypothetical protein